MKELTGTHNAEGLRLAIVVSRFNSMITENLLGGAKDAFHRCGGRDEDLTVVRVPGSFEISATALKLAQSGRYDAVACLGCLIRGETPHFDYIASEATRGINEAGLRSEVPVTYGVITTDTVEQAFNRCGVKHGNKGAEAVTAAIEMANLYRQLGRQ